MYYKAILYDNNTFEVIRISDDAAYGVTSGFYIFTSKKCSGTFAVRKTKTAAIKAIKSLVNKKLKEAVKTVENLTNILENVK